MKPEHEQSKRLLVGWEALEQSNRLTQIPWHFLQRPMRRVSAFISIAVDNIHEPCVHRAPIHRTPSESRRIARYASREIRRERWKREDEINERVRVCRGGRVGDRVGGRECWKECIKASTQNGNVRGTKTDTTEDLLWEWRNLARRTRCARRELDSWTKKLSPLARTRQMESTFSLMDGRQPSWNSVYRQEPPKRSTINSCSERPRSLLMKRDGIWIGE